MKLFWGFAMVLSLNKRIAERAIKLLVSLSTTLMNSIILSQKAVLMPFAMADMELGNGVFQRMLLAIIWLSSSFSSFLPCIHHGNLT